MRIAYVLRSLVYAIWGLYKPWLLRHNDLFEMPLSQIRFFFLSLSLFSFCWFPYFSISDVLTTEWLKLWRNNRCSLVRWPLGDVDETAERRREVSSGSAFWLMMSSLYRQRDSDSPLLLSAGLGTPLSLSLSLYLYLLAFYLRPPISTENLE